MYSSAADAIVPSLLICEVRLSTQSTKAERCLQRLHRLRLPIPAPRLYPLVLKTILATVLCICASTSIAHAWGGDGHQIVCLIAEDHLTSAAKAGIHELLGPTTNISDAEIASWADEYRRQNRATAGYHFVDIPTTQPSYDAERDGKNGDNVIDKINDFEKVLADKTASHDDRAQALKFIVHLVGDVHQPLHCAERDGDKGGNGRLVFFLDRKRAVNLHSCWDTQILLSRKKTIRVVNYADGLNARITASQAKAWAQGTALDWANESHQIAVEKVYKDVPAGGDPPKLDQAYVNRSADVVDQQLEKAGVRLAIVLNRALGP
jgi:hypothetical protein